jgi:hypothetical protein
MNLVPPYSGSSSYQEVTVPGTTSGTRVVAPGSNLLQFGPNLFSGSANAPAPEDLWYVQPDKKNASQWTWTFEIQHELPMGISLTADYIGSKSSNLSGIEQNYNTAPPSPDTNYEIHRPVQFFHDALQPVAPVLQLNSLQAILSGANATYEGGTVALDKRFSKGLAFGASYVYRKALGESSGSQDAFPIQNPRDLKEGRGPLPFDQRQKLNGNFVYELPWLRTTKGFKVDGEGDRFRNREIAIRPKPDRRRCFDWDAKLHGARAVPEADSGRKSGPVRACYDWVLPQFPCRLGRPK